MFMSPMECQTELPTVKLDKDGAVNNVLQDIIDVEEADDEAGK